MKALSDVKLKYLIDKIKGMFSLKDHTHDSVSYAEEAGVATQAVTAQTAETAEVANSIAGGIFTDGGEVRLKVKNYTGNGEQSLSLYFDEYFFPIVLIILNEEDGGSPMIIMPRDNYSMGDGFGGFGMTSLTECYWHFNYTGKTVNGTKYVKLTISSNDKDGNPDSTALQLYNAAAHNYRATAIGYTKISPPVIKLEEDV